jgi:hypothetical protein
MKKQAGLPGFSPKAKMMIEHLLADGELPPKSCARCGAADAPVVEAVAECEKAPGGKDDADATMVAILLFGLWGALWAFSRRGRDRPGDDVIIRVPLRLCNACRQPLMHDAAVPSLYLLAFLCLLGAILLFLLVESPLWLVVLLFAILGFVFARMVARKRLTRMKELWRHVPIYKQLLDEYPDAKLLVG